MANDDCAMREPEITALLDGELAGPEAAAIEAHLRACPACAVLARDLAAVGRALRAWDAGDPAPPVSAGFRARLLDRVAAGRRAPATRRPSAPAPAPAGRLRRLLPAAAAAAAVLAAGGLARFLAPRPGGSPPAGTLLAGARAAAPTVRALLDEAAAHAAAGRPDLERGAVLAAFGTDPSDPAAAAALDRVLGFAAAGPGSPPSPAPAAAAAADPGAAPETADPSRPGGSLWAGPWRFQESGAFDDFLRYRERAREQEIALAAREAAREAESTSVAVARPDPAPIHPLTAFTASLEVGAPLGGDGSAASPGITVYPLRFRGGAPAEPATAPLDLPSALAGRSSERPVLREARARNDATVLVSNPHPTRPLLLLAGEVLDGGRADRVVARDALVPAGSRDFAVAVYAVEAGRESDRPSGTRFRSAPGVGGPRLRGLALGQAAPEEVAEFVRGRLEILGVKGLRRSLADAYSDRGPAAPALRSVRPQVEEILRGLRHPDTVGFAVAHGGELLGVEVFGSHGLLARDAGRVLEGCALEAATYRGGAAPPGREAVVAFLDAATRGRAFAGGDGSPEVGVLSPEGGLLGSGVSHGGALLHAALVRGAGTGALAGRASRSGDFPGGSAPPAPGGESGGGTPAPGEGGSSGGGDSGPPDTTGGSGGDKPREPGPPERPR